MELGGENARELAVSAANQVRNGAEILPGRPITATGGLLLIEAVKVSFASALGKRYKVLVPALGDTLAGARTIAEHVLAGGRLPHRQPYVFVQGQYALTGATADRDHEV